MILKNLLDILFWKYYNNRLDIVIYLIITKLVGGDIIWN